MNKKIILLLIFLTSLFLLNNAFAEMLETKVNKDGTFTVIKGGGSYGFKDGEKISSEQAGDLVGCATGGDCSMFNNTKDAGGTTEKSGDSNSSSDFSSSKVGSADEVNSEYENSRGSKDFSPKVDSKGCDTEFGCGGDLDKAIKKNEKADIEKSNAEARAKEEQRNIECEFSQTCLDKSSFVIDTNNFSVGGTGLKGYDLKSTITNVLGNLIKKMMIALGAIALLVMTIGAGYMIMYRGHDEYLSKGKNIFMGGIAALIVALSSYYIVNIIGYILFK